MLTRDVYFKRVNKRRYGRGSSRSRGVWDGIGFSGEVGGTWVCRGGFENGRNEERSDDTGRGFCCTEAAVFEGSALLTSILEIHQSYILAESLTMAYINSSRSTSSRRSLEARLRLFSTVRS